LLQSLGKVEFINISGAERVVKCGAIRELAQAFNSGTGREACPTLQLLFFFRELVAEEILD